MKLKFFDARILGNLSRRGRKPTAYGLETTITVGPYSGRIYLSTGLVKKFMLDVHRFGIAVEEHHNRIFFYIDDEHGFRLQHHQHSYFVQSKTTVQEILTEISDDDRKTVVFEVDTKGIKHSGKFLHELILRNQEDLEQARALDGHATFTKGKKNR